MAGAYRLLSGGDICASRTIPQTDEGYKVLSVPALSIFRPVFG